jgi:TrmH family RNA methyltransferase
MSDVVTSLQNDRVKLVYSLQHRPRARRKERKLALEGVRLIRDAVTRGVTPEFVLYTLRGADYELIAQLQNKRAKLVPVSDEVMAHISDTQQPQGMIAVVPLPLPALPRQPTLVLVLDGVREPGNLGTMLRSAAAAGVDVVALSSDCVDPYNPKALRAAMGAHFALPILELQWFEIAELTAGMQTLLADGKAERHYTDVDFTERTALIIGGEAHGAAAARKLPQVQPIRIPMFNATESLNAAAAASVILFEAQRQRLTRQTR